MEFKKVSTNRITRGCLENYIRGCSNSVKFYGKFKNLVFLMIGERTGILDLENNKFIFYDKNGISYPVLDCNNNNYYMVIRETCGDKIHYNSDGQPRYSDTSSFMYDMDDYHNLECYCNIYNEDGENVYPLDRYLANIYQFNSMLDGDDVYKTIRYRDECDTSLNNFSNDEYFDYDKLPFMVNPLFRKILSTYSYEDKIRWKNKYTSRNSDNYNLSVISKKGRYSVINNSSGLIINYDSSIKFVEVVDNDVIMLTNKLDENALYDVNKGHLIDFSDNIKFNNAYKLCDNVFKLEMKQGNMLVINNKKVDKVYDKIYALDDNKIVARNSRHIDLYDVDGNIIFNANTFNFYIIDNDIFYCEDYKFYHYNLSNGEKRELDILRPFKIEDGTSINLDIDSVLEQFNFYSNDTDYVLFRSKKYGIELGYNKQMKACKWFDSREDRERYMRYFLESLINICDGYFNEDNKSKIKTRKLN